MMYISIKDNELSVLKKAWDDIRNIIKGRKDPTFDEVFHIYELLKTMPELIATIEGYEGLEEEK